MSGTNQLFKSANLTSKTITKPFIIRQQPPQTANSQQSLYSVSHIYLHPMVLDVMKVSWGSQVTIENPKNKMNVKVFAFSSDTIQQNCIETDDATIKKLDAKFGMCVYLTAKTQDKVIHFSQLQKHDSSLHKNQILPELDYAYDKTDSYQLMSKIIDSKLKIQLKSFKSRQCPKVYLLQLTNPINKYSIYTILKYLQSEQNYQVYPEKGVVQIITVNSQSINLALKEQNKPKTIDTEVIMKLIQGLYKMGGKSIKHSEVQQQIELTNPYKTTEQQNLPGKIYTKPSTYQKTYCDTNGKPTTQDEQFDNVLPQRPKITKVTTQFALPKNSFGKYNNLQIRKIQQQVSKISQQIQQIMARMTPKSQGKKDSAPISICDRLDRQNSDGTQSVGIQLKTDIQGGWIPNFQTYSDNKAPNTTIFQKFNLNNRKLSIVPESTSFHELQSSLKQFSMNSIDHNAANINYPDFFDISQKSIRSNVYNFIIRYKQQYEWMAISPLSVKDLGFCRHKMKILNSKNKFIFYGLMNKKKLGERSLWRKQDTIGCFIYNSQIYQNGQKLKKGKNKDSILAKEGQSIQIKVNKLFNEIIWIVDGYEKIKIKDLDIFQRHNIHKDWVCFVELFTQGDTVEFISQVL